jgi:hypothetical protein
MRTPTKTMKPGHIGRSGSVRHVRRSPNFDSDVFPEPLLAFGGQHTHVDPKTSLGLYGHYSLSGQKVPVLTSIIVGIVGPPSMVGDVEQWLEARKGVLTNDGSEPFLHPHYLGWFVGAVLLLAAAVAATWRQGGILLAAWERSRAQRQGSEVALFARVLDACRASDAKATYSALFRWLDSTHHGPDAATFEDFLGCHPDADLRRQVEALQGSFLSRATDWNGVALAHALRRARRKDLRWRTATDKARLPALNPPCVGMLLVVAFLPCLPGGLARPR